MDPDGASGSRVTDRSAALNPNGAGRLDQRVSGLFEAKTERRAGFVESGMFTTMSHGANCLTQARHRFASLPQ